MTAASHDMAVRHSSATAEHYTPPGIVEAARSVMGRIDLDPASCAEAQATVRAKTWFSASGLETKWWGRVFLNPPGGKTGGISNQKRWWQRLAVAWANGEVEAAIFVSFSIELLQTSQVNPVGFLPLDFPICFPSRRVAYLNPGGEVGGSPPHASCIVCLPSSEGMATEFRMHFGELGRVVIPLGGATR